MDQLRRELAKAKQRSAKARESADRQRALILDFEKNRRDTSMAEDVLRTLIEAQHLYEDAERRLIEELKEVARRNGGQTMPKSSKHLRPTKETSSSTPCLSAISL